MQKVTTREMRSALSRLLKAAERGSVITITRRGRAVARIVPPAPDAESPFPDLTAFRKTVVVRGTPASRDVVESRDEERF